MINSATSATFPNMEPKKAQTLYNTWFDRLGRRKLGPSTGKNKQTEDFLANGLDNIEEVVVRGKPKR